MAASGIGRRAALRAGAGVLAAGAAALRAPMVHAQGTGGRLSLGFWDHWVPAGNDAMRPVVMEWAQRNRVEVQLDFITSVGKKNLLTIAAEAQARQGHDVLALPDWSVQDQQRLLEPVDDVMAPLIQSYGKVNAASEYLGKAGDEANALSRLEQAADLDPANDEYATLLEQRYTALERTADFVTYMLRRADKISDKALRSSLRTVFRSTRPRAGSTTPAPPWRTPSPS